MEKDEPRILSVLNTAFSEVYHLLPKFLCYCNLRGAFVGFNSNEGLKQEITYFQMPKGFPIQVEPFMEGPFLNEDHFKCASIVYSIFKQKDFLYASQLLLKRLRVKSKAFYDEYLQDDFIGFMPEMLEHTFIGALKSTKFTGIHFLTSTITLAAFKFHPKNNGIFVASPTLTASDGVSILNKVKRSTFWPMSWSIMRFIMECAVAWTNKRQDSNERFYGISQSGIEVLFCFKNGNFITVYPVVRLK